jgi:NADH dehydrogenase
MKVIVVGGTGFLGRQVTAALLEAGHGVLLLARGTRVAGTPAGVEVVPCDVGAGPVPLEPLRGSDALVNLAGIKREEGTQTFARVHVDATRHLLAAAGALGLRRFVHVSVAGSRPDARSGYHDTKWRAEELVRASGLNFTILKPAVIYGPGDDMVTHLVKMIRFAPIFPVVGKGDSILQPVHVRDVARAVVGAIERDQAVGQTYEIAGPKRMTLREVVRTVAEGTSLTLWIVNTPVWFQRGAVRVMNAVTRHPLSTPAQLQMLIDGLYGDPGPAQRDLGVAPGPFTADEVRPLTEPIPPLFGFSLRLVPGMQQAAWLDRRRASFGRMLLFASLAVGLLNVLSLLIPNVWYRMSAFYLALAPAAVLGLPLGWRELLAPRVKHLAAGVAAAVVLYLLAGGVYLALSAWFPALTSEAAGLYAWKEQSPLALAVPLLACVIVPGEEIVWRGAVTLPAAARWGPWWGCLVAAAAFSAAHLAFGSPLLLLAAAEVGFFWNWLVVKTRSLVPALLCHLLWDLTVLLWLPY